MPQWTSATGPEAHDRLVIDLDPGEGAGITECCQVALLARELLAADGLRAWAKTSSSKGLHLYAPIGPATGDEATGYAKKLAQRLQAQRPDRSLLHIGVGQAEHPGAVAGPVSPSMLRQFSGVLFETVACPVMVGLYT